MAMITLTPEQQKYANLLQMYRRLANGESGVYPELHALEQELGFIFESPAPNIDALHRRLRALERENTLLSIIGGGIQRCYK